MRRVPRSQYDELFTKYAGNLPLAYIRALAYMESGFNPNNVHPKSHATGLFQITKIALDSYNNRNKTTLRLADIVDPELNTRVGTQHLSRVVAVYSNVRSLYPDWSSRRWVELVTIGWNAGHNGVARLAKQLEQEQLPPERVTIDAISGMAARTGHYQYIADQKRVSWAKGVTQLYFNELGQAPLVAALPSSNRLLLVGAAVGVVALGVAVFATDAGEAGHDRA